jgi:hypothetical protein
LRRVIESWLLVVRRAGTRRLTAGLLIRELVLPFFKPFVVRSAD